MEGLAQASKGKKASTKKTKKATTKDQEEEEGEEEEEHHAKPAVRIPRAWHFFPIGHSLCACYPRRLRSEKCRRKPRGMKKYQTETKIGSARRKNTEDEAYGQINICIYLGSA